MFSLMEREDVFQASVFYMLCPTSHDAPEKLGTTKLTLCATQTHHLSSTPSLLSISSPLLPKQVTPTGKEGDFPNISQRPSKPQRLRGCWVPDSSLSQRLDCLQSFTVSRLSRIVVDTVIDFPAKSCLSFRSPTSAWWGSVRVISPRSLSLSSSTVPSHEDNNMLCSKLWKWSRTKTVSL